LILPSGLRARAPDASIISSFRTTGRAAVANRLAGEATVNPNVLLAAAAAFVLAGCASTPPASQAATDEAAQADAIELSGEEKAMSTEEKVAAYNRQAQSEKDQLVCRREHQVGSNFRKTVCYTRQEMEEMRRAAQDEMAKRGRQTPAPGSN
jgi:hypothetical protein